MTNMAKDKRKRAIVGKFFRMPKKILIKMRDFYVNSLSKCDSNVNSYGGGMGGPTAQFPTVVPNSFSAKSCAPKKSDEDLSELIRIASTRSLGEKVEAEIIRRQMSESGHGAKVVPRSVSVAIGRIDEDKPCEFEDEVQVRTYVYPRSKTYAVTKRSSIS